MRFQGSCLSDVGRIRRRNEDAAGFFPDHKLYLVADGMGGHAGGQQASEAAVQTISAYFDRAGGDSDSPDARLLDATREANRRIFERAASDRSLRGMGTTLVALLFREEGSEAVLLHIGDSRAYRARDGRLERLTADHSLVADLVKQGDLSEEQARSHPYRNTLTRALGVAENVQPELASVDVRAGDLYVLASDGAYGLLTEDAVAEIVLRNERDPQELCRELIAAANAAGGRDNSTVIAVRCLAD